MRLLSSIPLHTDFYMFSIFLRSYRKLIQGLSESQMGIKFTQPQNNTEEDEPLSNVCSKITIYLKEDGEFAVATDFTRQNPEVVEVTGVLLHMINSGYLAEYFVKSLKIWSEDQIEQESFAKDIIKKWKTLFNESEKSGELAVDPSDVFGLKRTQL